MYHYCRYRQRFASRYTVVLATKLRKSSLLPPGWQQSIPVMRSLYGKSAACSETRRSCLQAAVFCIQDSPETGCVVRLTACPSQDDAESKYGCKSSVLAALGCSLSREAAGLDPRIGTHSGGRITELKTGNASYASR